MTTQTTTQSGTTTATGAKSLVQPYLFFGGTCEQALNFYKDVLGAKIGRVMRFKDSPEQLPEGQCGSFLPEHIMHAEFRIGESTIMASDGCGDEIKPAGFSLSVAIQDVDEARRIFDRISEGGEAMMPFGPTFFAKGFGMTADKFGIPWMIVTPQ